MKRWPRRRTIGVGRQAGLAVAVHHRARAADDFARLAGWQLAASLVDQADVVARQRPADGVQFVGMLVREQCATAAAFGHAVVLDEAARPAREDVGLQRGGKRRAGAELHPKRAQVEVAEARVRQQPLILHRHEHRMRRAVPLRELEIAQHIERVHQHDAAA
jgi:hypothetical protein